jgi:hypothetical protein
MERRGPFYTTQDGSGTWKKGGTNVLEHLYRDRNVLVIAGTAGHKRVGLCQTCPPVNQTQAKIIAGGRGWGRGEGGGRNEESTGYHAMFNFIRKSGKKGG